MQLNRHEHGNTSNGLLLHLPSSLQFASIPSLSLPLFFNFPFIFNRYYCSFCIHMNIQFPPTADINFSFFFSYAKQTKQSKFSLTRFRLLKGTSLVPLPEGIRGLMTKLSNVDKSFWSLYYYLFLCATHDPFNSCWKI